jgi:hypothetical protein
MADAIQSERKGKSAGEKLSPAMRAFVERVLVPALVREYEFEQKKRKEVAPSICCVADSAASSEKICEVPR